ncbi:MAG TPA: FkbM family methyltransferase [Pseudomonadales bacterium]|nr:FkbM family methyltransferase [Pseudomonadales bacterium]
MGVIVQIGAGRGNDHVTPFYDEGHELYLVEANAMHIATLDSVYPNANIVNMAIVTQAEHGNTLTMYYSTNDAPGYEVTSLDIGHVTKHGLDIKTIHTFDVYGMSLTSYLWWIGKPIEILFIDIEGHDEDVLCDTDLSAFDIAEIQVEMLHIRDTERLTAHMEQHGYTMTNRTYDKHGYDRIWSKV